MSKATEMADWLNAIPQRNHPYFISSAAELRRHQSSKGGSLK
jgi:hypothetical protein